MTQEETQNSLKISVALAIFNEEKNLARCLDSVVRFADEIVIVDGESTDSSVAIAKKYKSRVITTSNKSNFHINKQMAIDACQGDLILQLDADEVVDDELAQWIVKQSKKTLPQLENEAVAWYIARKNFFLGKFLKKGGQYPDKVIRFFVAGKARLPQKDVHEQMIVDGLIKDAQGHLIHYANPTFADYLRKFNTYTDFKAQQLIEKKVGFGVLSTIKFLFFKPFITWFSLFLRHRGYVDGMAGFTFALFSGLHHAVAYLKAWEIKQKNA